MIQIAKEGDNFKLIFTGPLATHSAFIPISEKGFKLLVAILSDQEAASMRDYVPRIAEKAAPIQYMVEQFLKNGGRVKVASKRKAKETMTLEDLELPDNFDFGELL